MAQTRSADELQRIAQNVFDKSGPVKAFAKGGKTDMCQCSVKMLCNSSQLLHSSEDPIFYVYGASDGTPGFAIVSAHKDMPSLLGFSTEEPFSSDIIPASVAFLLESMMEAKETQIPSIDVLSSCSNRARQEETRVEPLLGQIAYNQSAPYNALCPTINGQHCKVGCVPVAMAQIMAYYRHPERMNASQGIIETEVYGDTQATWDCTNTIFDWGNLLDAYNNNEYGANNYSEENINAVATLCAACGFAAKTRYGLSSSSTGYSDVISAFTDYYNYSDNILDLSADLMNMDDWHECLQNELKSQRPFYMSGTDFSYTGHAFVVDGVQYIDGIPYYHINWGWGGYDNGYYLIDYLRPAISGGSYSDRNVHAITRIMPESALQEPQVILCNGLKVKDVIWDTSVTEANEYDQVSVSFFANNACVRDVYVRIATVVVGTDGKEYTISNDCLPRDYCRALRKIDSFSQMGISFIVKVPGSIPTGEYELCLKMYDLDTGRMLPTYTKIPHRIYLNTSTPAVTALSQVASSASQSQQSAFDMSGRRIQYSMPGQIVIEKGRKRIISR